jgi:Uncharacterized protein conserved in bacteria (DUF2252)
MYLSASSGLLRTAQAMNIVDSTSAYEAWLNRMTDVQQRAIARKHEEMRKGPFPFLRATFYRWVRHWKVRCPELDSRDQDVLLSVGDLHVENFGIWLDSRGRLVWGINDFDEACELPFTNDLVRLTTSIALAAEAGEIRAPLREICDLVLNGYRKGIEAEGRPILVEHGGHPELKALVDSGRSPMKFWKKQLDRVNNPRIRAAELPSRLEEFFCASLPRRARPTYRRERKPGGLGSLGRRRFTAVVNYCRKRQMREAKALVPSALYWFEDRPKMLSQTGTLLQRAIRDPDPHFQVHDKWLVRRIGPDALKIELPTSQKDQRLSLAPTVLRLMGFETANIHLGSRAPANLIHSLDSLARRPGSRWLEVATEKMVKATHKDHRVWKSAKVR